MEHDQVSKERFYFKNKLSAFEGMVLRGIVVQVFLRGSLAYDKDKNGFDGLIPQGRML